MSNNFNDSNFNGRTPRTLQESKFGPYAEMECYRCEGDDMAFSRPVYIAALISLAIIAFLIWVLL